MFVTGRGSVVAELCFLGLTTQPSGIDSAEPGLVELARRRCAVSGASYDSKFSAPAPVFLRRAASASSSMRNGRASDQ